MKAMVLCAGRGTRLGRLTEVTPKPLLPVNNEPVLAHILRWLSDNGLTEIVINLHHLGYQIRRYLMGTPDIIYTNERRLLGTSGGVRHARRYLGDTFAVTHGDTLHNFSVMDMIEFHRERQALATIALYQGNSNGAGLAEMDGDHRLKGFHEKVVHSAEGLINAGVYILDKGIFDYIPKGFSDFGYNVFPSVAAKKLPVYGYVLDNGCSVIDIGTLEGYERAKKAYGE